MSNTPTEKLRAFGEPLLNEFTVKLVLRRLAEGLVIPEDILHCIFHVFTALYTKNAIHTKNLGQVGLWFDNRIIITPIKPDVNQTQMVIFNAFSSYSNFRNWLLQGCRFRFMITFRCKYEK